MTTARTLVFISYCHTDLEWLRRLQTHLAPLAQGGLSLWDDTQIRPGGVWREEIQDALQRARVGVLLVSPDFLSSEFITQHELPKLLDAARKGGLTLLWVPLRPSLYESTEIGSYQAAHPPTRPLSTLTKSQADQALVDICMKIRDALQREVNPTAERLEPILTLPPGSCVPIRNKADAEISRSSPAAPIGHLSTRLRIGRADRSEITLVQDPPTFQQMNVQVTAEIEVVTNSRVREVAYTSAEEASTDPGKRRVRQEE